MTGCKVNVEKMLYDTNRSQDIRVKILNENEVLIESESPLVVKDNITGEDVNYTSVDTLHFEFNGENNALLNGRPFCSQLKISSSDNSMIVVNGAHYLGYFIITACNHEIEVINIVPLETYLISVLPSEMPLYFMSEALKAQAVISRTYAVYNINKNYNTKNFDVDNTTNYQVYNGYDKLMLYNMFFKIKDAVTSTKGMILTYENEPIITFFHANSGGQLVSGRDYFGVNADKPYLVSKPDPYSEGFPGYRWDYAMNFDDFNRIFGFDLINNSPVIETAQNGQVSRIELGGTVLSPKDVRWKIGLIRFKSNKFIMNLDRDNQLVKFEGMGFGHGVGLSQWGAQGMALKGFRYDQILNFYYPGTTTGNHQ